MIFFVLMCRKESCPPTSPAGNMDPSFTSEIQPIFTDKCAGPNCHDVTASGRLNLSEGQAYTNIVNVQSSQDQSFMRVLPGDAESSYLVKKIEGDPDISGFKMPMKGELENSELSLIKNWINQGAKNN